MQTFIADIIPKLQKFSQKLDDLTLLTNQHWVVLDELTKAKNVYIFRSNNELLISSNGKVEKGRWEYLGNNSLLIDRKDDSFLFKHGFFDENVMALKIDGKEEYAILVNESRFNGELNSVDKVTDFLSTKYLSSKFHEEIGIKRESEDKIVNKYNTEKENEAYIINSIIFVIVCLVTIFFFYLKITYFENH